MGVALSRLEHAESLELSCVRALSEGDASAAFQYADRRCRIAPIPQAYHHVLRAEALYRLGAQAGALAALVEALAIAPADFQANRRVLSWGSGTAQSKAAELLLAYPLNGTILEQATAVLRRDGRSAVASVRILDDTLVGWVAWNDAAEIKIEIRSLHQREIHRIAPNAVGSFRNDAFAHTAAINLERPRSPWPQLIQLSATGSVFHTLQASPNSSEARPPTPAWIGTDADVTVIVPIYADEEATRACLLSLHRGLDAKRGRRAILVDDASPDPGISSLLDQASSQPEFFLLRNPINLGFAASVNRALACLSQGDVILLNADTVVPQDLIQRLAGVARSDARIGTVTPISNNGEFTSFPEPFKPNPMVTAETATVIDQVAASINRELNPEIPNGIGFCLYITRSCLNSVGALSQSFGRGYLEDVDFCLRARERDFKNVCAASVYVGHVGSRSFGSGKRTLVVRNVETIEYRFPGYRQACAAFMAADPLRAARRAVERALPPLLTFGRLVVAGSGTVGTIAAARARHLSQRERPNLVMQVGAGKVVEIKASEDTLPQNLRFEFSQTVDREMLLAYLRQLDVERIELADPAGVPYDLVEMLMSLQRPFDLVVADAGLLCPAGSLLQHDGSPCRAPKGEPCCDGCRSKGEGRSARTWRAQWAKLMRQADRIVTPCPEARAFAKRWLPRRRVTMDPTVPRRKVRRSAQRPRRSPGTRLGVVPMSGSLQEFNLIRETARAFAGNWPSAQLTVLGATVDDLALMASGNVFVSGVVADDELCEAIRCYDLDRIFLPVRQPLFGHPRRLGVRDSGLPVACFDWCFGEGAAAADLALDPALGGEQVALRLKSWFESIDAA